MFINARDFNGATALYCAVARSGSTSNLNTVMVLIDHGADLNIPDNRGTTPLMIAATYSDAPSGSESVSTIQTVHALLVAGADWSLRNDDGLTALELAQLNSVHRPGYRATSSQATVDLIQSFIAGGVDVGVGVGYNFDDDYNLDTGLQGSPTQGSPVQVTGFPDETSENYVTSDVDLLPSWLKEGSEDSVELEDWEL